MKTVQTAVTNLIRDSSIWFVGPRWNSSSL